MTQQIVDVDGIAERIDTEENNGSGRNVLADDFDIDEDAAHPERFRRLFDEDPRKSVAQPGGAMFDYLVRGGPAVSDGGDGR